MIRIGVDLTNPGQFFGCCGIFELAHRLHPGATAHFDGSRFIVSHGRLDDIVDRVAAAPLTSLVESDLTASPIFIGSPFELRLDWWKQGVGDPSLKPWAGTMLVMRITLALRESLNRALNNGFFDDGHVVMDADGKKVEPFYFDSRRGASALPLDSGFSPDALGIETVAFPATEFLTLVGMQRFRPRVVRPRLFRYTAWNIAYPISLAAIAMCGGMPDSGRCFQFENGFRTDQRKHKAFSPAVPVNGDRQ